MLSLVRLLPSREANALATWLRPQGCSTYGTLTFNWAARAKPAAMIVNCAHPARSARLPEGLRRGRVAGGKYGERGTRT